MNLADLPPNAFDIHVKDGCVVHFKQRITVTATSRYECLQKIRSLGSGKLELLPSQIGQEWRATFVQHVTMPEKEKKTTAN